MTPQKAYILAIDDEISKEYTQTCIDSCKKVGMPYEVFYGIDYKKIKGNMEIWGNLKFLELKKSPNINGAGACATAGHVMIWNKIVENKECAIILEHDSLLLHKVDIEIPDETVVVLGYKVTDPENYKHEEAGPPNRLEYRKKHGGAHAYALTWKTAERLIKNIKGSKKPLAQMIDNAYFLSNRGRGEDVPLAIVDPIAALGWLRKSTIWKKSAVDNYKPILDSFKNYYKSEADLGLKNP